MSFRDSIIRIAPPWLQGTVGSKLLYSVGAVLDALADATIFGVKARMPGECPPEAYAHIGADRIIVRGFDETDAAHAIRLRRFLDDHKQRGNPWALMRQVQGYLSGHAVKLRTVDNSGNWYTLNADGTPGGVVQASPNNWNWDGNSASWCRFWLIIYPPADLWTEGPNNWGDAAGPNWGAGTKTWGSTATVEQVTTIREIVRAWMPAHAKCQNIIIAFDPASFNPSAAPFSAGMPDGQWGNWSKNVAGTQVPSRLGTARYWNGT